MKGDEKRPYTRCLNQFVLGLFATFTFVASMSVADTPTSEEEALREVISNRVPLALSGDGAWLFYVDSNSNLHRVSVDGTSLKSDISLSLAGRIRSLSASRDGSLVAFSAPEGCIGLATLNEQPRFFWLPTRASYDDLAGQTVLSCSQQGSMTESDFTYSPEHAVALSSDGNKLAVYGNPVRILDVESAKTLLSIPTGYNGQVLHLQFLDQDRKLLVVLAGLRSTLESNNIQFLVWDLEKKTLFNFHRTDIVQSYDYHWHFSELTGDLWAIRSGSYGQPTPVQSYQVNLKECGSDVSAQLALEPGPREGWRAFSADPQGRWLAMVEQPGYGQPWQSSLLRIMGVGRKVLHWQAFESELRPLLPSADGRYLFGIVSGKGSGDPKNGTSDLFSSGPIELIRVDLSHLDLGDARTPRKWPESPCVLENEIAEARQIVSSQAPLLKPIWAIQNNDIWQVSPDGRLWRFKGDSEGRSLIERIDPRNGQVVQTLNEEDSLFSQVSFLLLGYEKLGVAETNVQVPNYVWGEEKANPVIIHKAGWKAESAWRTKQEISVLWSRLSAAAPEYVHARYLFDGKLLDDSTGTSSVDSFDDNFGYLLGEGQEIDPWSSILASNQTHSWERSVAGSLRAFRIGKRKLDETVFWQGLNLIAGLTKKADVGVLLMLDGSLVAEFTHYSQQINIWDAEARKKLAVVERPEGYYSAAWVGSESTLLLGMGMGSMEGALYAYRIKVPQRDIHPEKE